MVKHFHLLSALLFNKCCQQRPFSKPHSRVAPCLQHGQQVIELQVVGWSQVDVVPGHVKLKFSKSCLYGCVTHLPGNIQVHLK